MYIVVEQYFRSGKDMTTKEKTNAVEFEKLSYQEKLDYLHEQEEKKVHKSELKKIKDLKCIKCGTPFKLPAKTFEDHRSKSIIEVCKKCDIQNRIGVRYHRDENGIRIAEYKQTLRGYPWETKLPGMFNGDETKKWVEDEDRRIQQNNSRYLRREDQIQVRALQLALDEIDKLKKEIKKLK
jgi:RNase P subunit RPR2